MCMISPISAHSQRDRSPLDPASNTLCWKDNFDCRVAVKALFCLLVVLLSLSLSEGANAGTYKVTYSGGYVKGITDDVVNKSEAFYLRSDGSGKYGNGAGGTWGTKFVNGVEVSTSGSVKLTGPITVNFTWEPSFVGENPPPAILISEYSRAVCSANTFGMTMVSCTNGIGSPTISYAPYSGLRARSSEGYRYSIKQNPGTSFTLENPPDPHVEWTAQGSAGPPKVSGSGQGEVYYKVTPGNIDITFAGTIKGADGKNMVLIGQQVTASLSGGTVSNWVLPTPAFKSYVVEAPNVNNITATLNSFQTTDLNKSSVVFHCVGMLDTTVSVKCTGVAEGQSFTIAKDLMIKVPESKMITDYGEVVVRPYPPNTPNAVGPYVRTSGLSDSRPAGVYFSSFVKTPDEFSAKQGTGDFHYVQLIREQRYKTKDDGTIVTSPNTSNDFTLDKRYPYDPAPYAPSIGWPGKWSASSSDPNDAQNTSDTPGTPANDIYKRIEVKDEKFKMYLMYIPPGTYSQWVPIRKVEWDWKADVARPLTGRWTDWPTATTAGTMTVPSEGDLTDVHPIWGRVGL